MYLPAERSGQLPPNLPPPGYPMEHVIPAAPPPPPPREPPSLSTTYNGRIYSLEVVQQPVRARMCGFGDKVGAAYLLSISIDADQDRTDGRLRPRRASS